MSPVDEFLKQGMRHVYGDKVEEPGPFLMTVMVGEVGLLLAYLDEDVHFTSGVLSGFALTNDLVAEVANVNETTAIGSFYFSAGADEDNWKLIYSCKLRKGWIDPGSRASAQM